MTEALRPRTLEEALALRAAHPEATVVAGGTDLMVGVNFGRADPSGLLDLSRIDELTAWARDESSVSVGSGVTFARIADELDDLTALAEAASTVGSPQIRNRATLGGNIVTASPAGDGIAALAAYDASIVVARHGRGRTTRPVGRVLPSARSRPRSPATSSSSRPNGSPSRAPAPSRRSGRGMRW